MPTKYLETPSKIEPQIGTLQRHKGNRILFRSDGLHNRLETSTLSEGLAEGVCACSSASALVNRVMEKENKNLDNFLALVVLAAQFDADCG